MKEKRQSALKTALLGFVVVFVTAIVWNLFRKTSENVVDAFFIAVITAVLLALPGGQAEEWVSPKVTLFIVLPDDPSIRTLIFLKPVFGLKTGYLSLLKVGSMDLWTTLPTGL